MYPRTKTCFLSLICFLLWQFAFEKALAQMELPQGNIGKLSRTQTLTGPEKQMQVLPKDKTVIDMDAKELHRYFPSELRRLKFDPNQGELSTILEKTGERLQSFFRDFSNTASKESVYLQKPGNSGGINRDFSYLVLYRPNPDKPLLEEFRTDRQNRPITQNLLKDVFITSGYVSLSLNFHPAYQRYSRFRYLGTQSSDPNSLIIAFAQTPEMNDLQIEYTDTNSGMRFRLPVQGIAWIDPNSYQILRLRINLLGAESRAFISEQSTDIKLGEVRFDETQKKLWLPREVVVNTQISGYVFRNQHRYSNYKLFAVDSDFTIDKGHR